MYSFFGFWQEWFFTKDFGQNIIAEILGIILVLFGVDRILKYKEDDCNKKVKDIHISY